MTTLKTVFDLTDKMSEKLQQIASSGSQMVTNLEKAGDSADASFAKSTTSVDGAAKAVEKFESSASNLNGTAKSLSEGVDKAKDSAEGLSKGVGSAADKSDKLGKSVEDTAKKTKGLGEELDEGADKAKTFGGESAGAFDALEQALVSAGIIKGLKEIFDGFVECAHAAIEFESAVTGVYKTVDGTDEQLAAISDDIKDMSTHLPATTTEIAGVAEAAGQLGIATENITGFTGVMIDLGEATNLSSDVAASSLAKFANVTQMSADHYSNLGSVVVALGNNFATTEADIVAMATNMASSASIAGFTEPQIMALAAAMSSVGMEAAAGGSSMARLISSMQVAVETGSEELEDFARVANMSGEEFSRVWGNNAVDALYAFISGLNDTQRIGGTATVMLENMGITDIRLSNAVKALARDHEGLTSAIKTADSAWEENTALTKEASTRYATLESKLAMAGNASNNFKIAFGDVLTPAISKGADIWTGFMAGLTSFIEENPWAVSAVTALATALGTAAIAIGGFVFVTKVAIPAIHSLTAALSTNPVFLAVAAVAALTAGVIALASTLKTAESEYDTFTATSKAQYNSIQNLNAEYEVMVKTQGETSAAAQLLKHEIEEQEAAFQSTKETMEEYTAAHDEMVERHEQAQTSYEDQIKQIGKEESSLISLVSEMERLASKTSRTAAESDSLSFIISKLNESFPELALNYDKVTGSAEGVAKSVRDIIKAEADRRKYDADIERGVQAQIELDEKLAEQAKLQNELNAAEALTADLKKKELEDRQTDEFAIGARFTSQRMDAEKQEAFFRSELEKTTEEIKKQEEIISGIELATESNTEATKDSAIAMGDWQAAADQAIASQQSAVNTLVAEYDTAFDAARKAADQAVGLFDTVKTKSDLSTGEMMKALKSQAEYWDKYAENVGKASEINLDKNLLSTLSDGSEESAGRINAIVREYEKLEKVSPDKAKSFIDDLNKSFENVGTQKDSFADSVATMETDFSKRMDGISTKMAETVDALEMSGTARANALSTIDAYIQGIGSKSKQNEAYNAALAVANAAQRGLNSSPTPGTIGPADGVVKKATGTNYAPEIFIAGECGPELIIGAGGSKVFTASETSNILSDARHEALDLPSSDHWKTSRAQMDAPIPDEKKFIIELVGKGKIKMDGSMSKEEVADIVMENVRPAIMSILEQEAFEEGDLAYDF